ncbi:hypothetical protein GF312_11435 [Candidatus Poribacteria bacterium]|nr:hypothetical protein [Candidatus Poribacteria bacterium]
MAIPDSLKITYIGGGSRFVVVLLHGLAGEAEKLKNAGWPIELELMDISPERARPMARYAEITAAETGLDLKVKITDNRDEALRDSDWILFSVGPWKEVREIREQLGGIIGHPHGESTPMAAIEAASLWPYMRKLAQDIHALASTKAIFSTLVNPTDILSGAFEKAFGIKSIGTCVEVPQLVTWLCHNLKVKYEDINLQHIGVNHVGWVSKWTVKGHDGTPILKDKLTEIMSPPDWNPRYEWFTTVFQATGYLRASQYHNWPHLDSWDKDQENRRNLYYQAIQPQGEEFRKGQLEKALAENRMIREIMPPQVHYEHRPYNYMNTRRTLGVIASGIIGATTEYAPMQIRNGDSNPDFSPDAWLEVPVFAENGEFKPQYVPPLPDWIFNQISSLTNQRENLTNWLSELDSQGLVKALFEWPGQIPVKSLLDLSRKLPKIQQFQ